MSIVTRMLKQTAVLWTITGWVQGVPTFAAPISISVRWTEPGEEEKGEGAVEVLRYSAVVFCAVDAKVGDYLLLGSLPRSSDPRAEESWEVQDFKKVPNFRATEHIRKATCAPSHLKLLALHARGVEEVVYKRLSNQGVSAGGDLTGTTTSSTIRVALRGRLSQMEVEQSRGRFKATDSAWEIPKYLLLEPGLEDWFLDAAGTRWNVVGWEDGGLRSWWRVMVRRAS